jgi:hypothetical protein
LASCYLFKEEYAKDNHLIDAVIEWQAIARRLYPGTIMKNFYAFICLI